MARGGVQGFADLQKQFDELNERLQTADVDKFCRIVAKELAARLLAQVIRRTPVGDYPKSTGRYPPNQRAAKTQTGGKNQARAGGETRSKTG